MEKSTAGLLGALAGLATMGSAQAATPLPPVREVMHVTSYADLLKPIPNAAEILRASNAELLARGDAPARLQDAQYDYSPPPDYHHHHHHHHQGGVTIVVPGLGAVHTN